MIRLYPSDMLSVVLLFVVYVKNDEIVRHLTRPRSFFLFLFLSTASVVRTHSSRNLPPYRKDIVGKPNDGHIATEN